MITCRPPIFSHSPRKMGKISFHTLILALKNCLFPGFSPTHRFFNCSSLICTMTLFPLSTTYFPSYLITNPLEKELILDCSAYEFVIKIVPKSSFHNYQSQILLILPAPPALLRSKRGSFGVHPVSGLWYSFLVVPHKWDAFSPIRRRIWTITSLSGIIRSLPVSWKWTGRAQACPEYKYPGACA